MTAEQRVKTNKPWIAWALFGAFQALSFAIWMGFRTQGYAQLASVEPSIGLHCLSITYGFCLLGLLTGLFLGFASIPLWWSSGRFIHRTCEVLLVLLHAFLFFLLFLEFRLMDLLGLHLDSPWLWETLNNPHIMRELQIGASTWNGAALLIGVGFLMEWTVLWISKRLARSLSQKSWFQKFGLIRILVGLWVVSLCATMAMRLWPPVGAQNIGYDLPFYNQILGTASYEAQWTEIQYPKAEITSPTFKTKRPIVFIMVESFRADHLTPELTPNLWALKERGDCWLSPRHYSTSHTTEVGVFAMLYGLNPTQYLPFATEKVPAVPMRFLRENGYSLGGASASQLREWNHGEFMVDQLDVYEEFLDSPMHGNDTKVVAWAEKFIEKQRKTNPFFMFLFFNAPHHNYYYPPEFERYTPAIEETYDHFLGDEKLEQHRQAIHNRYRNSLAFTDANIATVLNRFDSMPGAKPIVIISGDHGEEFWEHGLLGHGATKFWNERIQVPLIACLPNTPVHSSVQLSSHVDVWPTVLDALQKEGDTPIQTTLYSNGHSWLKPAPDDRVLFAGGMHFPYNNEQACIIAPEGKTWVRLCPGKKFCVRQTHATDLDDKPIQPDAMLTAKRIQDLSEEIQRFVRLASE